MEKIVLITGGAKGIGKQLVKTFLQDGYFVIFTYNTSKAAAEEFCQKNSNCAAYFLDVKNTQQCQNLVSEIVKKYGKISCLVNNAGISFFSLAMDCSEQDYYKVLDTNFKGVFNMTKSVLPFMSEQDFGRIVNISSIWGQTGACLESLYAASKGAIDAFTKSIAKEMASKNITCNAVSPGIIQTDMNSHLTQSELQDFVKDIPVQRQGTAQEVAALCLYLANDTGYINGQIIGINGGLN